MPSRSSGAPERVLRLVAARGARRLVIDGRSGAGKTTLARTVAAGWPGGAAQLVSLDELYPGWGGLREGAALACSLLLAPHLARERGRYRRFDWGAGTFAGEAVEIDPERALVVEGCGALTGSSARMADAAVWLDGDAEERRRRALERDGDGFRPHWERWAAQEELHIAAERPRERAHLRLRMP
ncbi:nucleoside/nucleotide kinase family protein [Microbacterium gilvum]|uniref:hypothetical protein n=1 Tax=Microbacterium gilvum TaxID=1336204 RepID=UPI0031F11DF1